MSDWKPEMPVLRRAARHIAHDLMIFRRAWLRRSDRLAYNAWFVYCRNLLDFFSRKCEAEDRDGHRVICAWHFFDSADDWNDALDAVKASGIAPDQEKYELFNDAANKLGSHLSYGRLKYEAFTYEENGEKKALEPDSEITQYIFALSIEFFRRLDPERLHWFRTMLMV